MNTALWIVQGLLALVFLMSGGMKILKSKEEQSEKMAWMEDFSQGQIRLIGLLEVLAAAGLILPGVSGVLPVLVPLSGAGLAIIMIGAAITHLRRKEQQMAVMNLILGLMAAFVAYGRFVLVPL